MEVEYAYDERTALSLYDCLVPKLKEHRRLIRPKDYIQTIYDYQAKQQASHYEYELEKKRMPKLLHENGLLKARIEQLEVELELVAWQVEVMEDGLDTREVVKRYTELTKAHKLLEKKSNKQINKLTNELEKTKNDLNESLRNLKRQ